MIAERDLQIKASYARHSQHAIVLTEFSLETRAKSARSRKPITRELHGAHVGGVEDEGRSQSVCSIYVCVGIYIPTLTLYMSDRKRAKAVVSEGVNY